MKGTIIEIKSGQVPPRPYLERVYKAFPSLIASATTVNDGTPELVQGWTDELPSLDEFVKDLEANKNDHTIYAFYNLKEKIEDELAPPYSFITDDANNALVVGLIEGDFKTEALADVAEFLIKTYAKTCNSDLKLFEGELEDKTTKATLENFCDHRGALVLFSVSGRSFWFEKHNPVGQDYPWGRVSNKLDFIEQSSKDVKSEEVKAKAPSFLDKIRKNKTPATAPVIAKTEAVTTIAKENAKNGTTAKETKMIAPPPDMVKSKDGKKLGNWYKDWTDATALTKEQQMKGDPAPANDKWLAQNAGRYLKLDDAKQKLQDKLKNVDAKYKEFIPLVTPRLRHVLNELLESDKVKAITGAKVLNPDDLKNGPVVAPWSAQMGRDLLEVLRWDDEVFDWYINKCVAEKDTVPIRLLFTELTYQLTKFMVDAPEKPADKPADDQKTTEEPAPAETKVDPTPSTSPAATGKPNPFARFKKSA